MYIVITQPHFFPGESERITMMMQSGLQRLHIRKPGSDIDQVRQLIAAVPSCYHGRIVLHDHFELLHEFALAGVHLNSRCPAPPSDLPDGCSLSRSCHSITELAQWVHDPRYTYLSLSPIFDSISKQGYSAAFSADELRQAAADGIICHKVMALGGVCADNITTALDYGFGGVMVLGDAWHHLTPDDEHLPIVLSIAGSDPSAGAGIQQDLKTITHHRCYGTTVITTVTTQNTMGVQSAMNIPAEVVESQLRAVFADMRVDAVKIGIIPDKAIAEAIIRVLREEKSKRILPIVYDPVVCSTSGHPLITSAGLARVRQQLIPLCTLVTPNLPEAQLIGEIQETNVLIKGGHAEGEEMTDTLFLADEKEKIAFSAPKVTTTNLHGTGCTLSSAIACQLAQGHSLRFAVENGKKYTHQAILGGRNLHLGHGNGPLWI